MRSGEYTLTITTRDDLRPHPTCSQQKAGLVNRHAVDQPGPQTEAGIARPGPA